MASDPRNQKERLADWEADWRGEHSSQGARAAGGSVPAVATAPARAADEEHTGAADIGATLDTRPAVAR